jgi:hypothetical protein
MTLWSRKQTEDKEKTKLEQRVSRLPTSDLLNWSDQAIYSLGRDLSDWRKGGPDHLLLEAEMALESLTVTVRELKGRRTNG